MEIPEEVIYIEESPARLPGKRIKWANDTQLETVKFFKLTDLPTNTGLSKSEVEEVQKHIANVPTHMMYTELKKLDMKLDRKTFEE